MSVLYFLFHVFLSCFLLNTEVVYNRAVFRFCQINLSGYAGILKYVFALQRHSSFSSSEETWRNVNLWYSLWLGIDQSHEFAEWETAVLRLFIITKKVYRHFRYSAVITIPANSTARTEPSRRRAAYAAFRQINILLYEISTQHQVMCKTLNLIAVLNDLNI